MRAPDLAATLARWLPAGASRATESAAPPAAGPASPAPVNLARLAEVTGGDEAFEADLIGNFLADSSTRIDAIGQAIDSALAAEVANLAHALRGSASNLGADALAEVASELERLGKRGELGGARTADDRLRSEWKRVRSYLGERASSLHARGRPAASP